jgi:2-methylfumaryl-CoA isomerase
VSDLFTPWFRDHSADEISTGLAATSVQWDRYRTFAETAVDPRVTDNPLFSTLHQPRIGEYFAPGLPLSVDGEHVAAVAAPALGDDTTDVLTERLGMTPDELHLLHESGVVATP